MSNIKELPDFSKARLLVYGDVMLDRYWYGATNRISPEAPVPVVNINNTVAKAGGAANVALNAKALGVDVRLCGVVGTDAEGDELLRLVQDQQIQPFFQRNKHAPTVTKLRVLGQNQQLLRLDFEKPTAFAPEPMLINHFASMLDQVDVVVLSDYAKGALSNAPDLIDLARAKNVPVLVDPKHHDFGFYRGATLLTPNLAEFERVVGACDDVETIVERAQALMVNCDIEYILVTRGKDGMLLVSKDGHVDNLGAKAREVFDVTGAGDTVISTLASSMAAGLAPREAIELANAAAGIVVGKIGAETVSPTELRRAMRKNQDSHLGVLKESELMQAVKDARAIGEKLVMTNGCFDILHPGHVAYLQQAKALGQRLIVAVNTDDSVKKLKGDERPFNDTESRMDMLAALGCVDWVVSFSEQTPRRLICQVLPDVLVKGGDYTVSEIAGAKEVLASGGSVEILTFKDGYSTTRLVQKIRGELA